MKCTVHAANGYLINQFIDGVANKRTDEWGGSPEKRCKFLLEILKDMVEVFGPDVSIKLSPTGGYNDMGFVVSTLDPHLNHRDTKANECTCIGCHSKRRLLHFPISFRRQTSLE